MTGEASPAQIVRKYLLDRGVVGTSAVAAAARWPCVTEAVPPDGANVVVVTSSGSIIRGRMMRTGELIEWPKAQVLVRAADASAGWAKGREIQDALLAVGGTEAPGIGWVRVQIGDWYYTLKACHIMSPLTPAGEESGTRRWLGVLNTYMIYDKNPPQE